MKKIALLITVVGSLLMLALPYGGVGALTGSGGSPSGSLACSAASSSSITLTVSWADTGASSARLYRFGAATYIKDFSPASNGSVLYMDNNLGPNSTYQYELRTGTANDNSTVILAKQSCTTAKSPSGTLTCSSSTTSEISLAANYTDTGTANADIYRTGVAAAIASFRGPNGSGVATDRSLSAGTSYSYQLRAGTAILSTVSCSTKTVIASSGSVDTTTPSTTTTSQSSTGSTTTTTSTATTTTTGSTSKPTTSDDPQTVRFNQQKVLNIKDVSDDAQQLTDLQTAASLSGATGNTYRALVLAIIILFLLCALVIWRFQPIFAKLDRDKSGLRRRIIIIVTLPSLIPLLGMGFLGYQQLSKSVKVSLSSQLEKAAHTSALKLDREFNIRRSVVTKTASDILQINSQYADQQTQLTAQKDRCAEVVKAMIPARQFSKVTSNDDCLPFLTGFAQLASSSGSTVTSYLNALNQGAAYASADITAQRQQRINQLMGSARHFFPDILEMAVIEPGATTVAELPQTNATQITLLKAHQDLYAEAIKSELAIFDASSKVRQLVLTYPVKSGSTTLGGVVVSYDTTHKGFVPAIWSSTPKPYTADQVFFLTTAGELVTPSVSDKKLRDQLVPLSKVASTKDYSLQLSDQTLITRTSPVMNTNWVVAVGAPASSVYAPLAGIQRTAILAIAGFLLLSFVLGLWFVGSIANEIERLLRGALAFAKGDLDYRIGLTSHDELQVLGETMNQMAADIKGAQNALIEKDKEFINIATHELKAPMTSIIGNLSMITEEGMGSVDDTARKLIGEAYSGTVRLRDIVTDMLDIARLESGHAEIKPERLNLADLISAIIQMQTVPAQQQSVQLQYTPPPEVPLVIADKNKLQIILTNFVSNAIKYNRPGGTVTVTHSLKDGRLITAIADTGLGIPDDQKAHIFEKFYRVNHQDRANVPGTGLGMHITKRFVEAMGGLVWFESTHGQGTTFYFSLPAASPDK